MAPSKTLDLKVTSVVCLPQGTPPNPARPVVLGSVPEMPGLSWPKDMLVVYSGISETLENMRIQNEAAIKAKVDLYDVSLVFKVEQAPPHRLSLADLERTPRRFLNFEFLDIHSKKRIAGEYHNEYLEALGMTHRIGTPGADIIHGFEISLRDDVGFLSWLRRYKAFSGTEIFVTRLNLRNRLTKIGAVLSTENLKKVSSWGPYGELNIEVPTLGALKGKASRRA